MQDDSARWRNNFCDIGAFIHFCPGLAKQFLTGNKGFFIFIFPEITKDEASFLVLDLGHHLPNGAGFLEPWQHLLQHLLPQCFSIHHVALAGEFRGNIADKLWFHYPALSRCMFCHMPSCKYIVCGATANRRATLRCCTARSESRVDGNRANFICAADPTLSRQIFIATTGSLH